MDPLLDPRDVLVEDTVDHREILPLDTAEEMTVSGKLEVLKDGQLLAEYNEEEIRLAPENQEVYCIIRTGEEEECSGEYQVKFYMNDVLVDDLTAAL